MEQAPSFDLKSQIHMYKEENSELKTAIAAKYHSAQDLQQTQQELETTRARLVETMKQQVLLEVDNVELKARIQRLEEKEPSSTRAVVQGSSRIDAEVSRLRVLNRELSQQLEDIKKNKADHTQCQLQVQQLRHSFELEKRRLVDQNTRDTFALKHENEGGLPLFLLLCGHLIPIFFYYYYFRAEVTGAKRCTGAQRDQSLVGGI